MHLGFRQGRRIACEPPPGKEPAARVTDDIGRTREICLAARVQPADPAPAQGVAGRVAIHQVAVQEVRAQLPRQLEGVDLDAGKPHSCVVVQVAGRYELGYPGIETVDAGPRVDGRLVPVAQARPRFQRIDESANGRASP